jgi:hypothetical protein
MKPQFIRTLAEGRAELAKLGIHSAGMKSISEMQRAISAAKKKPAKFPHGITPDNPAKPSPFDPKKDGLGDLIAAAKSERDVSKKVDLLTELSAKQHAAMTAEPEAVKKTDLMRQWQQTEKSRAYALLAERTASPQSAKARRLVDLAS